MRNLTSEKSCGLDKLLVCGRRVFFCTFHDARDLIEVLDDLSGGSSIDFLELTQEKRDGCVGFRLGNSPFGFESGDPQLHHLKISFSLGQILLCSGKGDGIICICGGIHTETPIRTNEELLDVLRTQSYTLLTDVDCQTTHAFPLERIGTHAQNQTR